MLPSWVGNQQEARVSYDVADSFHTAPGWRIIGDDVYTCVPPVDRAYDPAMLRWVQSFDPGAIPMWRKQRYLPPDSNREVTVTHFCIGRHVAHPRTNLTLFRVEMPRNATHPAPNELEVVFEMQDEQLLHHGGPGAYVRPGMFVYHFLRERYNANKKGSELAKEQLKARADRIRRDREAALAEDEYKQRRLERAFRKFIELPGCTIRAWREYQARQAFRRIRRQLILGTSKPFVHLSRGA